MLLFKMAEIKMTKTEINKLIEALDLNGDGMIDFGYILFLCFCCCFGVGSFSLSNVSLF